MKKQKLWLHWTPAPAVITSRQWFVQIVVFPTLPRANSLTLESCSPCYTSSNWMSKCFVSSTAAKSPFGKGWKCFWQNFTEQSEKRTQRKERKSKHPPLLNVQLLCHRHKRRLERRGASWQDITGGTQLFGDTSQHYDISFYWEHLLSRWYPACVCCSLCDLEWLGRFLGSEPSCSKFISNKSPRLKCWHQLLTQHLWYYCACWRMEWQWENRALHIFIVIAVKLNRKGPKRLFQDYF